MNTMNTELHFFHLGVPHLYSADVEGAASTGNGSETLKD